MSATQPFATEVERLGLLRRGDRIDRVHGRGLEAICHALSSTFHGAFTCVVADDAYGRGIAVSVDPNGMHPSPRELSPFIDAIGPEAALFIPNARDDRRFAEEPLVTGPARVRFFAGIRLYRDDGVAFGALCVGAAKRHVATPHERGVLADLATAVETTIDIHRAARNAQALAITDSQTGLPNRAGLLLEIERVIRERRNDGASFALIYIDVDDFKAVNDTLGHAAGDDILRAVAVGMRRSAGTAASASRLGGDEFVIVIPHAEMADAAIVAERIHSELAKVGHERSREVSFSLGLATFTTPPATALAALAVADRLMYAAKRNGKNRIESALEG